MYEEMIDAILDSYDGDDQWTFEDEVRTTINDCEEEGN